MQDAAADTAATERIGRDGPDLTDFFRIDSCESGARMDRIREIAWRACAGLHWLLLAGAYGRLVCKAFLDFSREWDFLAYHLPGALATYGLTSYTPEPRLVAVIAGFPPLPRVVAGALVLATGRFSAAGALNVCAFCGLVAGLLWLYGRRLKLRWLLTALLGVPLFVLHLASGYVDLFAGCWLALALAALSGLETGAKRPLASALLFTAAMALAMLSKLQAWPVAVPIVAAGLWRLFALVRSDRLTRSRALAVASLLLLAAGAWPVRNLIVYANPVYPVEFPLAPRLFPNAVVTPDSSPSNLPIWLEAKPRPVRFLASVAEWNRFHSGERYVWSLDQGARANPVTSPHNRLGGWFPWTIFWLALGSMAARRAGLVPGAALAAFLVALALVSLLPQANELRYWLFAPLALAIWTALGIERAGPLLRRALSLSLVAGALFVVVATRPFGIDARLPGELAPRAAREFWAQQEAQPSAAPVRICDKNPEGIFWSGPTFREHRVIAAFSYEEPCEPTRTRNERRGDPP